MKPGGTRSLPSEGMFRAHHSFLTPLTVHPSHINRRSHSLGGRIHHRIRSGKNRIETASHVFPWLTGTAPCGGQGIRSREAIQAPHRFLLAPRVLWLACTVHKTTIREANTSMGIPTGGGLGSLTHPSAHRFSWRSGWRCTVHFAQLRSLISNFKMLKCLTWL